MGTDIHIELERRKGGIWVYEPSWTKWNFKDSKPEPGDIGIGLHRNRNYDWFAILANVRNGRGFAGVVTGSGFEVISEPRGIPKDASFEIKVIADEHTFLVNDDGIKAPTADLTPEQLLRFDKVNDRWLGDHDFSWLTFAEIFAFDFQRKTTHSGCVNEAQYKVFCEKGHPDSYSGDTWGNDVLQVSPVEMQALINGESRRVVGKSYYTHVTWEETYLDCCQGELDELQAILKELDADPADVRMVFGFDS